MLLAFCVLFFLRFFAMDRMFAQIEQVPEETIVWVEGTLCKKEFKKEKYLYYLRDVTIAQGHEKETVDVGKLILLVSSDAGRIGDRIGVDVQMRWMQDRRNTGAFSEKEYYHSLGVAALLYPSDTAVVVKEGICPIQNAIFGLRERLREYYQETLNEKDAGILSAMVLGDKSLMEGELKTLYAEAGISHILAVSGLHVSMIGMTLFSSLRKARQSYHVSCLASGICLSLFCLMSGLSVSALRAGIMFLLFLIAQFLGRKYHSFRALLLAAGITLLWNPYAIFQAGFWLSYLAVAGAVGIGKVPPWNRNPERGKRAEAALDSKHFAKKIEKKGSCKGWLETGKGMLKKSAVATMERAWVSCGILFTTLPLTAYYFYEIPLYSVLVNVLVLPFAGLVLGFGLAGGLLGVLQIPCAWLCLFPSHLVLRFYELVCRWASCLPAETWITGKPALVAVLLYYSMLAGCLCLCTWKGRIGEIMVEKRGLQATMVVLGLLLLCVYPKQRQFAVSFLDVGQGDGICICDGRGRTYMIDGGSTSEKALGKYQILPFLKAKGLRRIDAWIISHADEDHISGMQEVIESGYSIEQILISCHMPQDEAKAELEALAKQWGIPIVEVMDEDCLTASGYQLQFFTPSSTEEDRNQSSLITLLTRGEETFLFTGDIGKKQEEGLLSKEEIKNVSVLKAAHHGSRYSNCSEFLEEIAPEYVVISAGEGNRYGHPHEEAVGRMETAGSKILLTMEEGEIVFRVKE